MKRIKKDYSKRPRRKWMKRESWNYRKCKKYWKPITIDSERFFKELDDEYEPNSNDLLNYCRVCKKYKGK